MPAFAFPFFRIVSIKAILGLYEALWLALWPLALIYFWHRGKKEPLYSEYLHERLGGENAFSFAQPPLWIHGASLGEIRGSSPFIHLLLEQGFCIVLTTLTPAGRQTAQQLFAQAIEKKQLQVVYAPLECAFIIKRFLKKHQPQCAIMTEIDTWPVWMRCIRAHGIALVMANAQYPESSFKRDVRWGGIRSFLFTQYDLILCKSALHAARFEQLGCPCVKIAGETRFDLPLPTLQLNKAQHYKTTLPRYQAVIAFASAIAEEDAIFIASMLQLKQKASMASKRPYLFIYVPRQPDHFDKAVQRLQQAGLHIVRRQAILDEGLQATWAFNDPSIDVLVGDSLGEMFFYLALSDVVVVGSSFGHRAAHNIIEPLALQKPVWTGPSLRGIEYPAYEALNAGVLQQAVNADDLASQLHHTLSEPLVYDKLLEKTRHFHRAHTGAAQHHLTAFLSWLAKKKPALKPPAI